MVVAVKMVGPVRPQIVLFGSSIVQLSYNNEGWGAILANLYARKVLLTYISMHVALLHSIMIYSSSGWFCALFPLHAL